MGGFERCVIRTGDEMLSPEGTLRFRALKEEIDRSVRKPLEAEIANGSISLIDAHITAFTLAGALDLSARWQNPSRPMSAKAIAAAMVDLLIEGILPQRY